MKSTHLRAPVRSLATRLLLAGLVGLVSFALSPSRALAQSSHPPFTRPFHIPSNVSAAGWHLNTNDDGQRNYGEFVTDIGGAAPTFPDPALYFTTQTLPTPTRLAKFQDNQLLEWDQYDGTIYGKHYQIAVPVNAAALNMDCAGWFVIAQPPTRSGTFYSSTFKDEYGPAVFAAPQFADRGAMVGYIEDLRGEHPMVETCQNALLLSVFARQQFGAQKVIVFGGSYGSAAALVEIIAFPDFFDGAFGAGGYLGLSEYFEWNQMHRIIYECHGRETVTNIFQPGVVDFLTVMGWRGMSPWNLDLTTTTGLSQLRRPTFITLGGCDANQITNGQVEAIESVASTLGILWEKDSIGYFRVIHNRNGGHAQLDPDRANDAVVIDDFVETVNTFVPSTAPFTFSPMSYHYNGKYLSFLGEAKTSQFRAPAPPVPSSGTSPCSQPSGPTAPVLTLEDRIGDTAGTGQYVGAAVVVNDCVYFGDRSGWVYKKTFEYDLNATATPLPNTTLPLDYDPGVVGYPRLTDAPGWPRFVGMSIRSIALGEWGGGTKVVVGHARGLSILDDATGNCVRERIVSAAANNVAFPDVRSITIGNVLAGGGGPQIVYQALRNKTIIEDASTGAILHESDTGFATKFMIDTTSSPPRLITAFAYGNLVAFELTGSAAPYDLTAVAISDYLGTLPVDFTEVGVNIAVRPGAFGDESFSVVNPPASGNPTPTAYPVQFLDRSTLNIVATYQGTGGIGTIYELFGFAVVPNENGALLYQPPSQPMAPPSPIDINSSFFVRADPSAGGNLDAVSFRRDNGIELYDVDRYPSGPILAVTNRPSTLVGTHFLALGGSTHTTSPIWQASLLVPKSGEKATVVHSGGSVTLGEGMTWIVETYDVTPPTNGSTWKLVHDVDSAEFKTRYLKSSADMNGNCIPDYGTVWNYPPYRNVPAVLVRSGQDPALIGSFEAHHHAGGFIPYTNPSTNVTTNVQYTSQCGRIFGGTSFFDAHDFALRFKFFQPAGDGRHEIFGTQISAETGDGRCPVDAPPAPPGGFWVGDYFWSIENSISAVDYVGARAAAMDFGSGPEQAILGSSPAGDLYAFNGSNVPLAEAHGLGWGMMAIAADDFDADDVDDYIYAGSLLTGRNSTTNASESLYVMGPDLSPVASIDAGHVVGISTAGHLLIGSSDSRELVVGCANGDLKIYSFNPQATGSTKLALLHSENLGSVMAGARQAMQVMPQANGDVLVGLTVDGGYMLLKINRSALQSPW